MSFKGKVFEDKDIPKHYTKLNTPEKREAWCKEQTERYKVVAKDGDTLICADELDQRALNKMSVKAKRVAGMMVTLPVEVRREIIAAFDKEGNLKYPFKMV